MVTPSGFGNHLEKSTIFCFFIQLSCVVSFSPKEDGTNESSSSGTTVNTPKKIIKKVGKVIVPYMGMKLKTKASPQEDYSPPPSKNKMKNIIGKVMIPNYNYMCLKIRQNNNKDEGCLWKKTILMGEKCQPLEFSGAIFYDSEGNQISEPPRSPRSSVLGSPYPKFLEIEM